MTPPRNRPRKEGRKVRVELRRNRGKTARDKSELTRRVREGDLEQDDVQSTESVRPKGDLSRKRTHVERDDQSADTTLRSGVVVTMRGLIAEVDDGEQLWACTTRRWLRTQLIKERGPLTVGDRVRFLPVELAGEESYATSEARELVEGVIEEIEPRKTTLVRHYERRVHVIAVNVDLAVMVVATTQPTLRPHLIDRCLAAIHKGGMRPIVCINKADLDQDGAAAAIRDRYRTIGYPTLLTSVIDGRELDNLKQLLQNQTAVLFGPSGVGKSSLINALDPGMTLKIGALSDLERGRHTTTTARLLKWDFGGYVVDTPGLRQFDLSNIEAGELEGFFPEFVNLIHGCRYPNCSHLHEEICAIKSAVEDGRIAAERYESYCRMYKECADKPKY